MPRTQRRQQHPDTTIAELLEMQPSDDRNTTWVDGDFEAIVENAERKPSSRGGSFFAAELVDPHDSNLWIRVTAGGIDLTQKNGCLVRVSGSGRSIQEYNNRNELRLGKTSIVNVIGQHQTGGSSSRSTHAGDSRSRTTSSNSSGSQSGKNSNLTRPHGESVGNALTNATSALIAKGFNVDASDPKTHDEPGTRLYAERLHQLASDYLRVGAMLRTGMLAEPAKARKEEPERGREPQQMDQRTDPFDQDAEEPREDNTHDDPEIDYSDVPY